MAARWLWRIFWSRWSSGSSLRKLWWTVVISIRTVASELLTSNPRSFVSIDRTAGKTVLSTSKPDDYPKNNTHFFCTSPCQLSAFIVLRLDKIHTLLSTFNLNQCFSGSSSSMWCLTDTFPLSSHVPINYTENQGCTNPRHQVTCTTSNIAWWNLKSVVPKCETCFLSSFQHFVFYSNSQIFMNICKSPEKALISMWMCN
jgi:hypothetical protein